MTDAHERLERQLAETEGSSYVVVLDREWAEQLVEQHRQVRQGVQVAPPITDGTWVNAAHPALDVRPDGSTERAGGQQPLAQPLAEQLIARRFLTDTPETAGDRRDVLVHGVDCVVARVPRPGLSTLPDRWSVVVRHGGLSIAAAAEADSEAEAIAAAWTSLRDTARELLQGRR